MSHAQHQKLNDLLKESGYQPQDDHISKAPKLVKRRICALKSLQLKSIDIEAAFYKRVHDLEREFEKQFDALFLERKKIVNGEHEPSDEEAKQPLIHGLAEEDQKALYDSSGSDEGEVGIPEFWLHCLKSNEATCDLIQEHDEPILKHLTDITAHCTTEPVGFTLEFHFSSNPYFKNTLLKKQYVLNTLPDPEDPFGYEGPECTKIMGDTIQWEDGKDVTKKVVKKKQKKGANAGKFLTKTVKADSFFNFFDNLEKEEENKDNAEGDGEDEEEAYELRAADYEIATTIRDSLIPRAVLFYTGEAAIEDDMFPMGEDDGDDASDSEDGEEEEEE